MNRKTIPTIPSHLPGCPPPGNEVFNFIASQLKKYSGPLPKVNELKTGRERRINAVTSRLRRQSSQNRVRENTEPKHSCVANGDGTFSCVRKLDRQQIQCVLAPVNRLPAKEIQSGAGHQRGQALPPRKDHGRPGAAFQEQKERVFRPFKRNPAEVI